MILYMIMVTKIGIIFNTIKILEKFFLFLCDFFIELFV